jgi:CRISPR/Cas system CSM-associated protein Csm3 (group 7 of RAMP superfamily)
MSDGASPRVVFDVEATLDLLSPLHVGSGGSRDDIPTVKGKDGANTKPAVATIVRDADGNPYVPGTTLKGLLRRLAEARGMDAERLFGAIKLDKAGSPGRVTVFGARRIDGPAVPHAPFVAGAEAALGKGVFVAARTRIDPASGTAGDHTLFHQEMAAPQTKFRLRLRIDARAGVDERDLKDLEHADHALQTARAARQDRDARAEAETDLADLLGLLNDLCADDGQAIGKSQADGFGRVRLLADSITVKGRLLAKSGVFENHAPKAKPALKPVPKAEALRFACNGPFLVLDASKTRKAGESEDGSRPHRSPQAWDERHPMLFGTSVMGALRARARWLQARKALRRGAKDEAIDAIDPDGVVWRKGMDLRDLSSVQRLFGVTGFRGRLTIAALRVQQAKPWDVTSVKLDRFTGGPVDNALFKTRAFLGVAFDLALALDERRPRGLDSEKRKEDQDLFDLLLADIQANGLILGHGGNKGFGWFRCEGAQP